MRKRLLCVIAAAVLAAGCKVVTPVAPADSGICCPGPGGGYEHPVNRAGRQAGGALASQLYANMQPGAGIMPTVLVDLDNLGDSSPLGRQLSSQMGSCLSACGFAVVQPGMAEEYAVKPQQGEFLLTRETPRMHETAPNVGAVLTGTYTPTYGDVYVSTRVVSLQDGVVLASYDFVLPNRGDVKALLEEPGPRPAYESPQIAGLVPRDTIVDRLTADVPEREVAMYIFFEFDSTRFATRFSRIQLDELGRALADKQLEGASFEIEGHADARGSDEYNMALSERRARAVQQYLTLNYGLAENRFTTTGKGESDPIADNETEAGMQMNRRVVIRRVE